MLPGFGNIAASLATNSTGSKTKAPVPSDQRFQRGPVISSDTHPCMQVVANTGCTKGRKLERSAADNLKTPYRECCCLAQSGSALKAGGLYQHLGVIIDRAIVLIILKTVPVAGQPYLNSLGDWSAHQGVAEVGGSDVVSRDDSAASKRSRRPTSSTARVQATKPPSPVG